MQSGLQERRGVARSEGSPFSRRRRDGESIGDAGYVILQAVANILTAPVAALVSSILFFDLGGGADAPSAREPPSSEAPAV
jgi:hypothetical protein